MIIPTRLSSKTHEGVEYSDSPETVSHPFDLGQTLDALYSVVAVQ